MAEMVVTPWEVKGKIDYDRLIKEFGLQPVESFPSVFQEELIFRRKIVYAARDFERISEAIKNKKPFIMMTGLMPTGRMHLGHMLVVKQMMFYQKLGAKCYICVADIEAYHQRGQTLEESREIALNEYLLNYFALGLDPRKCEIYFQSARSLDGKKSNAYYRLQELLAGHVTFNEFKAVYGEPSPGKFMASTLQASDMYHAQLPEFEGKIPVVIPVGIDQDPHIRIARDMARKYKGYDFIPISATYHRFMPGLGGGKMSSSDPLSFIALSDNPADVKKKVNKYAFSGGKDTVEEHRKLGGNPDVDVAFQWLTYLDDDDEKIERLREQYRKGTILSGEMKQILIELLTKFLEHHHKEREKARKLLERY